MTTSVYTFGGSKSASGLFKSELDGYANVDSEGKEKTSFLPGESCYFLLIYDSNKVQVVSLKDTAGGNIHLIGGVSRSKEEQITFQHPAHLVDLQYRPSTHPTAKKWYGRGSNLHWEGDQLHADMAPCLGDISYSISAVQYLYQPPGGIVVTKDEDFPIDVVIEWKEKP